MCCCVCCVVCILILKGYYASSSSSSSSTSFGMIPSSTSLFAFSSAGVGAIIPQEVENPFERPSFARCWSTVLFVTETVDDFIAHFLTSIHRSSSMTKVLRQSRQAVQGYRLLRVKLSSISSSANNSASRPRTRCLWNRERSRLMITSLFESKKAFPSSHCATS